MANDKVAFIWDFSVNPVDVYSWNDGLNAALKLLSREYGKDIYTIVSDNPAEIYEKIENINPDLILAWGSLDRPSFAGLNNFSVPVGLCFAGGSTEHPHLDNFDIVFVESEVYFDKFKEQGVNVKRAFGTNDILFEPLEGVNKKFEACYPAAFAAWKRHNLFAEAVKNNGLAIGKFIPEEAHIIQDCVDKGVFVLPQVPYVVLPYIINQSHSVLITADSSGGSQRAVLEAMACNVQPIVMSDSDKNTEYVKESGFGQICDPNVESIREAIEKVKKTPYNERGREYIKANYSAAKYAEDLNVGLESIK